MKKIILSMALFALFGSVTAQNDKAAAKAAAAALKVAKKEAKTQVEDAQKIYTELNQKINQKTATENEIMEQCKKAQDLLQKALNSGHVDEKKLGEAYKLSNEIAVQPHNLLLTHASNKEPIDTAFFYSNLKVLTNSLQNELKNTKVTKGEYGNEKALQVKRTLLSQCAVYYIYAAQFEGACKRYDNALESYSTAMNYETIYPEVTGLINLPVAKEQIAYYAFHTAKEAKKYDEMEKIYETALKFKEGALGTKQARIQSFLERGDTVQWAKNVHALCIENPSESKDYIQILLSYYQSQGLDKMLSFANEIIAVDDEILIAHYGKGFALFAAEKYDEALPTYVRCTEIQPDYYDAWYQAGLCKFRQAMKLNSTISSIKNRQDAKVALEKTKSIFGEAIPFFEKARECTPDDPSRWAYELKQCYSVTGQSAKAAEMDKLLQ